MIRFHVEFGIQVVLVLVFRKISPLFTGVANAVPAVDSKVPLRPPGAFSVRLNPSAHICRRTLYLAVRDRRFSA